uniref:YciE/YciF ferroxidase family protein n=1 Tax=Escherichia coli TaxID=562 RepID=UPI0021A2AB14
MNMKTIEDVFIHLLSDTYSAEKQLTRALAKLARATSNEKLSQAFHAHLEETHGQIERIDQVVESESNLKIKRMKCVAMEGLIEEAKEGANKQVISSQADSLIKISRIWAD